jgi:hypothetical protein
MFLFLQNSEQKELSFMYGHKIRCYIIIEKHLKLPEVKTKGFFLIRKKSC